MSLPSELYKEVKKLAKEEAKAKGEFVREVIGQYIKRKSGNNISNYQDKNLTWHYFCSINLQYKEVYFPIGSDLASTCLTL